MFPESIVSMMKWPRSKGVQAVIAFTVALLSEAVVFTQIAMESFNYFYFPPHKAFPYPYPTESAAHWVMYRDCGLTFLGVFAVVYMGQRLLITNRRA
jgi:hypothetical protein